MTTQSFTMLMTHHTNQTTGLTLFYKGVFSNFYNSPFTEKLSGVECKEWNNVEQYMHACKVGKLNLFGI